ncbi:MAG: hypothetical protein AAGF11_18485 [Myxococcota bacterium]
MSKSDSWSAVFKHLSFIENNAGFNGMATWGVEDVYPWDIPKVNVRKVKYEYGKTGTAVENKAVEIEVPGPVFSLPPAIKIKLYGTRRDASFLFAGELQLLSFKTLIQKLGLRVLLHPHVQKVAKPVLPTLRQWFDKLADKAPSIDLSGAFGLGLGMTPDKGKPYIRLLTNAEMKFKVGGLGDEAFEGAARILQLHEVDLTGGVGGGRSWQLSSLANIPSRF